MTVGARFRNGNNQVQIDSTYANHALLTSGTINLPVNSNVVINVQAQFPLLAYRGTGLITIASMVSNGAGGWSITVTNGPIATAGAYYIFDTLNSTSQMYAVSIGLRIRNPATGATMFDSRYKYMRVAQVRTDWTHTFPADIQTAALSQDNLAAVVANPGLWFYTYSRGDPRDPNNPPQQVYDPYFSGAGVNGTTFTFGSIAVGTETPISPPIDDVTPMFLLVDVSNY